MRFNTPAKNTLFVKVSVKVTPYSNKPQAVRIIANTFEQFTANNALCYSELPLEKITLVAINAKIQEMQARTNTARVSVKMQPKVSKLASVA